MGFLSDQVRINLTKKQLAVKAAPLPSGMDQGMRSVGSVVIGTFATLFGVALGLALASGVSIVLTVVTLYRLLGLGEGRGRPFD